MAFTSSTGITMATAENKPYKLVTPVRSPIDERSLSTRTCLRLQLRAPLNIDCSTANDSTAPRLQLSGIGH